MNNTIEILVINSPTSNDLTVSKQMTNIKQDYLYSIAILETI